MNISLHFCKFPLCRWTPIFHFKWAIDIFDIFPSTNPSQLNKISVAYFWLRGIAIGRDFLIGGRPWDIRGKVYLVIVRLVPLSKVVWRQVLICSSFHDIVHSASTGVTCVLIMSTVMLFEYVCVLLFLLLAVGIDSQSKWFFFFFLLCTFKMNDIVYDTICSFSKHPVYSKGEETAFFPGKFKVEVGNFKNFRKLTLFNNNFWLTCNIYVVTRKNTVLKVV